MFQKALIVILLASLHIFSFASESTERQAVIDAVTNAYKRDDFAYIERRYAEMNKNTERLPSGILKSARLLYAFYGGLTTIDPGKDILEADWITMEEKVGRWQKAYPSSSVAAFVLSEAYIGHAFFYRSGRLAREVDPAKWKPFHAYIERAAQALASPKIVRDPAWYCATIRLAAFQSTDLRQFAQLVDEASNHFPYFYDIYFFAAHRLAPKWGGSPEAFEWLANLAVAKTRKVEGQALYARLYWSIGQGDLRDDLFTATLADWKKMKVGFDDIVKRYPSEWNFNNYAWFACLARDQATLKQAFERVGDDIDRTLWSGPERLNRCRTFAREGE